jgi:hypothetical protein
MFGDETWQGAIELSMLPDARQLRFASFSLCASQTYHVPKGPGSASSCCPKPRHLSLSLATIAKGGSHGRAGERGWLHLNRSLAYKSACRWGGGCFAGKSRVSDAWARTMLLGPFLNSSSWQVVSPGTMSPLRPLFELYLPFVFLLYVSRSA